MRFLFYTALVLLGAVLNEMAHAAVQKPRAVVQRLRRVK